MMINKVISGGQTGVDRIAIDVAIKNELMYGGFVPKGRKSEDGIIPKKYINFVEIDTISYEERTKRNIEASDGTIILVYKELFGGSAMTKRYADKVAKPNMVIRVVDDECRLLVGHTVSWIYKNNIKTLNIAGLRASKCVKMLGFSRNVSNFINTLFERDKKSYNVGFGI